MIVARKYEISVSTYSVPPSRKEISPGKTWDSKRRGSDQWLSGKLTSSEASIFAILLMRKSKAPIGRIVLVLWKIASLLRHAKTTLNSHRRPPSDIYLTMPSKRFLYHLTTSVGLTLWEAPTLFLQRLRRATRSPGRDLDDY